MKDLIIICGQSGTGKDTILNSVISSNPSLFNPIVLTTTRPIRENESQGISYNFITEEEVTPMILSGEALSVQVFNNWYYILSNNSLIENKINIGVFNPEAVAQLLEENFYGFRILILYITTDDKIRLLRLLNRENNPNIDEIVRRYGTDKEDFKYFQNILEESKRFFTIENNGFSTIYQITNYINSLISYFFEVDIF